MSSVDINAELARAVRFARALPPPVLEGFAAQGLTRAIGWGFARIEYYDSGRFYEPREDGAALAYIIPVIEDGELVDLAAVNSNASQHLGTRLDIGRGLGMDAIAKARMGCCTLHLAGRPLEWLRVQQSAIRESARFSAVAEHVRLHPKDRTHDESLPDDYLYLFDLSTLRRALSWYEPLSAHGIKTLSCTTIELMDRVLAMLPPSLRDRVVTTDG